jgi:hypothetical protein
MTVQYTFDTVPHIMPQLTRILLDHASVKSEYLNHVHTCKTIRLLIHGVVIIKAYGH